MAQTDKVKLKLLVDMVKAQNERIQYLSYFVKVNQATDAKIKNKIKDIENQIE